MRGTTPTGHHHGELDVPSGSMAQFRASLSMNRLAETSSTQDVCWCRSSGTGLEADARARVARTARPPTLGARLHPRVAAQGATRRNGVSQTSGQSSRRKESACGICWWGSVRTRREGWDCCQFGHLTGQGDQGPDGVAFFLAMRGVMSLPEQSSSRSASIIGGQETNEDGLYLQHLSASSALRFRHAVYT